MPAKIKFGKAYDSVPDMLRGEYFNDPEGAEAVEREIEKHHVSNDLFILRCRSGLSRAEVAARMGVPAEYVEQMEDGDDPVRSEDAARFCAALGCEYESFSRKKELAYQ